MTSLGFPCIDTTCLKHYKVEGVIRICGQAADSREEGFGKGRMKGDKTAGKYMRKGKLVAPDKSLANNRTPGNYRGSGGGRRDIGYS